jgi:hypothetical protein
VGALDQHVGGVRVGYWEVGIGLGREYWTVVLFVSFGRRKGWSTCLR